MSDIVNRIDELVDASLARPMSERSGYDNNVNQDTCWHCGRSWHGLAITARMEEMRREYAVAQHSTDGESSYATSAIMGDYRYDTDESEIICPGSEFIGPIPTRGRTPTVEVNWGPSQWQRIQREAETRAWEALNEWASRIYANPEWYAAPTLAPLRAHPTWWGTDSSTWPQEYGYQYSCRREEIDLGYEWLSGAFTLEIVRSRDLVVVDEVPLSPDVNGNHMQTHVPHEGPSILRIHARRPPNIGTWREVEHVHVHCAPNSNGDNNERNTN